MRENKPDIDHLDVGCRGQRLGDADKQSGQDQECGQVHCDHRLEEERLEEVGGVHDEQDEDGREVGGQDLVDNPPVHHKLEINALAGIRGVSRQNV